MPQLRQNIITGEWVVIAPERARRPSDYVTAETVKTQSKLECPFCVERGNAYKNSLKEIETENIYVVSNKFPAFIAREKDVSTRSYYPEGGFFRAKPSLGGHEVIIVKEHDLDLGKFPEKIMAEMLQVGQNRYNFYRTSKIVEYVMLIYNHGAAAAASIEHPHAQLFASSIVPNQVIKEYHGAERYYEVNSACVFCDLIAHEKKEKSRVIYEDGDFIAHTFFASRFPFEIWLLPKKHVSQFEKIDKSQIASLSRALMSVLHMLDKTLNDPSLNFYIHTMPMTAQKADYFHWHLEITPRVSNYGGYELGSGMIIDVVSPEESAKYLLGQKE